MAIVFHLTHQNLKHVHDLSIPIFSYDFVTCIIYKAYSNYVHDLSAAAAAIIEKPLHPTPQSGGGCG